MMAELYTNPKQPLSGLDAALADVQLPGFMPTWQYEQPEREANKNSVAAKLVSPVHVFPGCRAHGCGQHTD
jgi:hypothetical protein